MYLYTAERRDQGCNVSVHCQGIGLYIPDDQEISRGPRFSEAQGRSSRDILRAEGNLEVGGDVKPNSCRLEAVYGYSLIINPSPVKRFIKKGEKTKKK